MKKIPWSKIIIYGLLLFLAVSVLIPLLNLLAMSLSDPKRVGDLSGLGIFPKGFSLINYEILLSHPLILRSIGNSLFITIVGTTLNLMLTTMTAYVLAKTEFVGKKVVIFFLIVIMVVDPSMITEYLLVKNLGLLDSYTSLILYRAISVYYLFILMRFFNEVPDSIIEAARIDGAGHFTIFTKIMLPLSKPAIATFALFYGIYHWNEYFRATIYLTDPNKWPLQVVLRQFVINQDNTTLLSGLSSESYDVLASLDLPSLQAGTIIISIIPLLLVYPLILKHFTKGALEGGVKD